jgi:hypothetical protein
VKLDGATAWTVLPDRTLEAGHGAVELHRTRDAAESAIAEILGSSTPQELAGLGELRVYALVEARRHKGRTVTPAVADAIAALHQDGLTASRIAGRLGVGKHAVLGALRARGLHPHSRTQSQTDPLTLATIAQTYRDGYTITQTAKVVGLSHHVTRRLLLESGVTLRASNRRSPTAPSGGAL